MGSSGRPDASHGDPPVCDPERPVVFEELWLGFVAYAARALEPLVEPALRDAVLRDPQGPLRSLLVELSEIGAAATFELFALDRSREASAEAIFTGARGTGGRDAYEAFVGHLVGKQLSPLWTAFPALAPLLSTRTELFIAATAELCERWAADRAEIEAVFPWLRGLGAPRHIRPRLSDAHGGGRTVTRLSFEGGTALFYKPRPVDMEWGYARFVEWFNTQDHGMPPLRALSVLRRADHGWMEQARPAPCSDLAEIALFYRRAGMVFALADLFCGVDFHGENLVASGDHPVLVDLETLFHPPGPFERDTGALERTELLPRPIPARNGDPYVVCGLGAIPGGVDIQLRRRGWRNINCDAMEPCDLPLPLSAGSAVPRLGDGATPLIAAASDEIVSGFSAMHGFFRKRRDELWSAGGPIARAFGGGRARFLLRATRIYAELMRRAVHPRELEAASSVRVFDRLAHPNCGWDALHWAERQALERMDVPYFSMETTARFVRSEGRSIDELFTAPGLSLARSRADLIDDSALRERTEAIRTLLGRSSYGAVADQDAGIRTNAA